jgi:hypothetical protein
LDGHPGCKAQWDWETTWYSGEKGEEEVCLAVEHVAVHVDEL